jgi:hypothetical protein
MTGGLFHTPGSTVGLHLFHGIIEQSSPSRSAPSLRWTEPLPHWPLLAGLVVGALAGAMVHVLPVRREWLDFALANLVRPVEQLFLQVLFLLILPMVFSAIVTGLARLRGADDTRSVAAPVCIYAGHDGGFGGDRHGDGQSVPPGRRHGH